MLQRKGAPRARLEETRAFFSSLGVPIGTDTFRIGSDPFRIKVLECSICVFLNNLRFLRLSKQPPDMRQADMLQRKGAPRARLEEIVEGAYDR